MQRCAKETCVSTNVYVGNLPFSATEQQVQDLFAAYGLVERVNLITDRDTGRLKGFGFVEMTDGAQEAIANLDQSDFDGRKLTVNLARPREERPRKERRW
jgi:RNA recognition motif-containing protein